MSGGAGFLPAPVSKDPAIHAGLDPGLSFPFRCYSFEEGTPLNINMVHLNLAQLKRKIIFQPNASISSWWFHFFIFTPIWGRFPI